MFKAFAFIGLTALSSTCLALDHNAVTVDCDQTARVLRVQFGKENELSAGSRYIVGALHP